MILFGSRGLQTAFAEGDTRTISMHHLHTDESITITYKRDGKYDEAALEKLNWFLRDWRKQQETRMDPHLIDLVWEVQREAGNKDPIQVVCGYRSPETNALLRRHSSGVAEFSQHMLGHAMDFYIPGVPLEQLRVIGLRLQRGGVGFYPTSGSPFVHLDVGHVRHWPRMTREQLVKVFPDGRTVHIPTDGRPLPGHALALADIEKRGASPSDNSIAAARSAGIDVADAGTPHRTNPFAKLLGFGRGDDDEDEAGTVASVPAGDATAAPALTTRARTAVVAAVERAEDKVTRAHNAVKDKLAAEKSKLAAAAATVAAKTRFIARAEAAPLPAADASAGDAKRKAGPAPDAPAAVSTASSATAAPTPNQIIASRGYWQDVPDVQTGALAGIARASHLETAKATGTARAGRLPHLAMAYAEGAEHESIASEPVNAAATGQAVLASGSGETTVAVKRVDGHPVSSVMGVAMAAVVPALPPDARITDPWLRAVMLSPSVTRYLSVSVLGARDFRSLSAQLVKPASSVMMNFAAAPQPGPSQDRFDGSAVVFLATVTYPVRTADLR
jgi:uncharacterized protein YcbK (DUF882 family)